MGYVYKITNTVNNKSYIGISVHEPTQGRIKKHLSGRGNRVIANAVKKYGKDAFTYEVLEANVFDEFLPDLEVAYIANFNTVAPHGYNLTHGGDHKIPCEETLRRMSEAKKGKRGNPHSAETRMKLSKLKKGKGHSEATRMKLSKLNKGEKNPNFGKPRPVETRRKISESNRGQKRSEVTRQRISEAKKNISAQTRRKISEAKKLPEYMPAYVYFDSLPPAISLQEKRKLLYSKFPNVKKQTLRSWVRKWLAS